MPELDEIGKKILLRHVKTDEDHFGVIEDVNDKGYVVFMDKSAAMFLDKYRFVDTRYDVAKWKIRRVING